MASMFPEFVRIISEQVPIDLKKLHAILLRKKVREKIFKVGWA